MPKRIQETVSRQPRTSKSTSRAQSTPDKTPPKSKSRKSDKKSDRKSDKKSDKKSETKDNSPNEKRYTKFNPEVLDQHELFAKYVKADDENVRRFICQACKDNENPDNTGYYDFLGVHFGSTAHANALDPEEQKQIPEAVEAFASFRKKKKVKGVSQSTLNKLAIEFTGFLLKHELPFLLIQELVDFTKSVVTRYGSNAIELLHLSNTKATQIAKQCISKSYKESIFTDLETTPFALSFDESSDIFGPSYLCTHVRYLKHGEMTNKLLSLDEIKEDATGESLYKLVKEEIFSGDKKECLRTNLMGVCSDRGSNMLSSKDAGLLNRLQTDYKHVATVGDFSHAFHNVTKNSVRKFPPELIKMIKGVSKHFKKSALRRSQLRIIQENIEDKVISQPLKILRYVETRWTSLGTAVERILLLWQSLEIYFDQNRKESLGSSFTEENRLYLELLVALLEKLHTLIEYFESDQRDYCMILPKLKETFTIWGCMIVDESKLDTTSKETKFNSLLKLPFKDQLSLQSYLKNDEDFRILFEVENPLLARYLSSMPESYQVKFLKTAKDFMLEALKEMAARIPFDNEVLNLCEIVRLESLNSEKWILLAEKFPNIVNEASLSKFHMELKKLAYNFENLTQQYGPITESKLGFYVSLRRDYPLIGKLALGALTLPYSTASVERTFSMLRDIKDPRRNRLSAETVEACLLAHFELEDSAFVITPEMLKLNDNLWKKTDKKEKKVEKKTDKKEEQKEVEPGQLIEVEAEGEGEIRKKDDGLMEIISEAEQPVEYVTKEGKKRSAKTPLAKELKASKKTTDSPPKGGT